MSNKKRFSTRVSVILPTYNYGHFISQSLDSVFQQDICDVEVIVVDDGSTDNTQEILQPYSHRIKYIFQENKGLSAARNTGIALATGEYFQFLDSDDILGPNALNGRLCYMEKHPECSIAVCRNNLFSKLRSNGQPKLHGSWTLHRNQLEMHLCHFNIAPPHAFLLNRKAVEDTGMFDTALKACEDYDYWLRATICGHLPRFCPLGRVFYRVHPNSMSAKRGNQVYHDGLLHLRLFDALFVKADYPIADETVTLLAYTSGLLLTISRLRAMGCHVHLAESLGDRLNAVLRMLEDRLDYKIHRQDPTYLLYHHLLFKMLGDDQSLVASIGAPSKLELHSKVARDRAYWLNGILSWLTASNQERVAASRLIGSHASKWIPQYWMNLLGRTL